MIGTSMFDELYEIHHHYSIYKKMKYSRNQMKIIIDSIIEQLYGYYITGKFNGIMNVRAKVVERIKIEQIDEDLNILTALNSLLRVYGDVFSKSYSDHKENYVKFIESELRELSLRLAEHSLNSNDSYAIRLRRML
ncbi:hypothetical protein ACN6AX_00725 [Paenibacillus polymyxa]|uniref:hypothetical protein n=1 Tax=Paenibacillus polymyxa TaxID=1406 RepID=UPI00211D9217|nr:hypothetical protein [Paenibacillus polymyxa]